MSNLTFTDKLYLEKVLDMGGGYVLEFSNASFERFFADYNVDIHSEKYQTHGTSKANKLRSFWEQESDDLVGRVLTGLLDVKEIQENFINGNQDQAEVQKGREIAARLSQKPSMLKSETHENRITANLQQHTQTPQIPVFNSFRQKQYDFFISHASEDKEGFVRQLADALQAKGASVWYDEFSLKVGSSLREEIERGLANSQFGVVVLSKFFFEKEWTNKELSGLFALEAKGASRILPIWHNVSADEVTTYSPILADKVALNTSLLSVENIANQLLSRVI